MAVLDPNEIMFTSFEPTVQNRFIMYVDGIPSFMIKAASMRLRLTTSTFIARSKERQNGKT